MKEYTTTNKGSVLQASSKRLLALASVFLFAAILLASIAPTASADPGWWNDSWQYRKMVTIDHTKVPDVGDPSTTYANFPVLVNSAGLSNIKADGADIRFTDSAGNQLPREIESYTSAGGILYAWVKVTLTKDAGDSADDAIYLYYGNGAATEPAADSTYGSEKVWDSNFKLVQHLQETSGMHDDSTANDNDGTACGGVTQDAAGKIDGADDFDGSNDFVDCGDNVSLNIGATGQSYSVEAWFKTTRKEVQSISEKWHYSGPRPYPYCLRGQASGTVAFALYDGTNNPCVHGSQDCADDQWHQVVGVRDASAGKIRIYVDGSLNEEGTDTTSGSLQNTADLIIGRRFADQQDYEFNGTIDEVRISSVARSADWINTSYKNQNSPSTFCGFGGEEQKPCGSCQRWYLSSTAAGDGSYEMWKGDETKPAGTVTVGDDSEQIWRADEAATGNISFPADMWTGHITFDASSNDTIVRVWVGEWNGSTFTPSAAGENATINGSGDFSISAGEFNVSKGEWLAFRVQDYDADGNSSVVSVGLSSSYLTSGGTDPAYPIPELSAMILFLVGALVLAGYLRITKKKE